MRDRGGSGDRHHSSPRRARDTVNPFPTLEDAALLIALGVGQGGVLCNCKREPRSEGVRVRIGQMKIE